MVGAPSDLITDKRSRLLKFNGSMQRATRVRGINIPRDMAVASGDNRLRYYTEAEKIRGSRLEDYIFAKPIYDSRIWWIGKGTVQTPGLVRLTFRVYVRSLVLK